MATTRQVIEGFIKLRDKKKELKDRHAQELAPINDGMARIEVWLLRELQEKHEGQSVKTLGGTAYLSTITKAKLHDPAVFMEFLQENNLLHMLEARASVSAVEEYIEATGEAPPGVTITRETNARVRK